MSQEPKRGHFAEKEGEIILREHEYDGIQEYDQKLPNWWLFTFYGAIVFFVVHWVLYYHTNVYKSPQVTVEQGIIAMQEAKEAELQKTLESLNDSVLVHQWATQPNVTAEGEATYMTLCSSCHAADLSATMEVAGNTIALPGLPLNDGEWKFGKSPMRTFQLINEGSPPESNGHNGAKMQAWNQQLSPKQIAEVVAYLVSRMPDEFADVPKP